MNNIKVSIVMPVKNAGNWLSDTIQSLLSQSFDNWELISVDDHSTDDSITVLREFASRDNRIQIIKNDGTGIIPALQLGLSLTRGEFITRMDADDIMPKDRLKTMVKALDASEPKTVVTGLVQYFPEPVSEGYRSYQQWINNRVHEQDHFDYIYRECVVASPNWMVRTDDIKKYGQWNELSYPEDYDMVFKWLANGFSIKGINTTTLLWREHPQRTSRNSDIYDQRSFFALKLSWFSALNPNKNEKIALFGAGQKGKIVANYLIKHNMPFEWFDHNFKRYNSEINGKKISDPADATAKYAILCINPELQETLVDFLREKDYMIGKNAWFF